jgi:uncharacterized protein
MDDWAVNLVVPAGGYWSGRVSRGTRVRLIDLEGCQAIDFLCYNAADPTDRYCAADTMKVAGSIYIGKGSRLYSDMGNLLFTVTEDTCGRHDTIGGCCSRESNRLRYGVEDGQNCRDNFLRGLAHFGMGKTDIVANINFFMSVPVQVDGTMAIALGHSKPGDYVELHAETDVLVAISNCPQVNNPCNNYRPTPIRLIVTPPAH